MTQAHALKAAELCVKAQQATMWGGRRRVRQQMFKALMLGHDRRRYCNRNQ